MYTTQLSNFLWWNVNESFWTRKRAILLIGNLSTSIDSFKCRRKVLKYCLFCPHGKRSSDFIRLIHHRVPQIKNTRLIISFLPGPGVESVLSPLYFLLKEMLKWHNCSITVTFEYGKKINFFLWYIEEYRMRYIHYIVYCRLRFVSIVSAKKRKTPFSTKFHIHFKI